jgi:hypothetical protein
MTLASRTPKNRAHSPVDALFESDYTHFNQFHVYRASVK